MAAEAVISVLGRLLVGKVLQVLGARQLDLERGSSGRDTSDEERLPELDLNVFLVYEVFVRILTTGVGALAFIWATVVLLGGFSVSLEKVDFWVITGIVFVQASKIVGINSNTEAIFFAQVPPAVLEVRAKHFRPWGRRRPVVGNASGKDTWIYIMVGLLGRVWDVIRLMALLTSLLLVLPVLAGSSCIALSICRLVVIITRHKYGGDGSYNSNVLRALVFFYALVLAQGGLFIIWLCIYLGCSEIKSIVCSQYRFQDKDQMKLIDKYVSRTSSECIKAGVLNTINRNLVSFTVDLLQSEYSQDRISAVLLLHTLISKGAHKAHKARALVHIQSSPDCMARMFVLLSPKSAIDEESKVRLAQIVAELSSELRLSDIDKATESISSLIDPNLTKISTTGNSANNDGQTVIVISSQQETNQSSNEPNGEEIKPLIIHGLMILAKLAGNPDNCMKIFNTEGLFSKITMPISNKLCTVFSNDDIAIEITEKSLQVLSKLVSGTDETSKNIRQEICHNGLEANRIRPILCYDQRYNRLKVPAIKILTKLALDNATKDIVGDETIVNFINFLMGLFFSGHNHNESHLRKTAGKALALLAMDSTTYCAKIMNFNTGTSPSVVWQLSDMLFSDNRSYRTAVAQLLRQFCVNCRDDQTRERLASDIKSILCEVLKVICNVDQEVNANDSAQPQRNPSRGQAILQSAAAAPIEPGRRKTLAAFLALAVEMCDKLIGSTGLDAAVAGLPLTEAEFVEELKEIIEMRCKTSVVLLKGRRPSVDYLVIIKSVTKFCTWVMRTKPGYVRYFQEKNVAQKLKDALEAMRGLELALLLTCKADENEMADYETPLSSIVEDARKLMLSAT